MSNEENYIIENEITDQAKKQEYWNTGIGLNKVDNLEPSKYLLDLCSCFNRFYANEKIVDEIEEKTNFRLTVSKSVAVVLQEGMRLLGISLPDRM